MSGESLTSKPPGVAIFPVPHIFDPSPKSLGGSCSTTSSDTPSPGNRGSASPPTAPNNIVQKACKCKECGKIFNSVWYLKQHAVKHSSDRPFKCKFCHKTYRFRSNLYQHKCPDRDATVGPRGAKRSKLSVIKHESPIPRDILNSMQEVAIEFESQILTNTIYNNNNITNIAHNQNTPLSNNPLVDEDDNTLDSEPTIVRDIESREGDRVELEYFDEEGECTKYIKKEHIQQQFIDNFLLTHKHELFSCTKCALYFPSREYLVRHNACHNYLEGRTQCLHCSEIFVNERQYAKHKQRHSPNSHHSCHKCRGKFVSRLSLRRHLLNCSGKRDMPQVNAPSSHLSFVSTSPPISDNERDTDQDAHDTNHTTTSHMSDTTNDRIVHVPHVLTVNCALINVPFPKDIILDRASTSPGAKNVFTSCPNNSNISCSPPSTSLSSGSGHCVCSVLLTPPQSPVASPILAHHIPSHKTHNHDTHQYMDCGKFTVDDSLPCFEKKMQSNNNECNWLCDSSGTEGGEDVWSPCAPMSCNATAVPLSESVDVTSPYAPSSNYAYTNLVPSYNQNMLDLSSGAQLQLRSTAAVDHIQSQATSWPVQICHRDPAGDQIDPWGMFLDGDECVSPALNNNHFITSPTHFTLHPQAQGSVPTEGAAPPTYCSLTTQHQLRFSCAKCDALFPDRWSLREHMLEEMGLTWKS